MLASDPSDCNTTKDSNFYIKNFCESNMYAKKIDLDVMTLHLDHEPRKTFLDSWKGYA